MTDPSEIDVALAETPAPDTRGREQVLLDALADLLGDDPQTVRAGTLAAQRLAAFYGSEAVRRIVEAGLDTGDARVVEFLRREGLVTLTTSELSARTGIPQRTLRAAAARP